MKLFSKFLSLIRRTEATPEPDGFMFDQSNAEYLKWFTKKVEEAQMKAGDKHCMPGPMMTPRQRRELIKTRQISMKAKWEENEKAWELEPMYSHDPEFKSMDYYEKTDFLLEKLRKSVEKPNNSE